MSYWHRVFSFQVLSVKLQTAAILCATAKKIKSVNIRLILTGNEKAWKCRALRSVRIACLRLQDFLHRKHVCRKHLFHRLTFCALYSHSLLVQTFIMHKCSVNWHPVFWCVNLNICIKYEKKFWLAHLRLIGKMKRKESFAGCLLSQKYFYCRPKQNYMV